MKLEQGKWYETEFGDKAFVELIRDWVPEYDCKKCSGFTEIDGMKYACDWNLHGKGYGNCAGLVSEWHEPVEATVTVYLYKSTLGDTFATTAISTGQPIGKKTVTVREGDGMDAEKGEQ